MEKHVVDNFAHALEEVYKYQNDHSLNQGTAGLGEMNAEQLWDTTMNPTCVS